MTDPIRPEHYKGHWLFPGNCIDYVRHAGFCQGNAMKYLWRHDRKSSIKEDLGKALWYVNKMEAGRKIPAPALRKIEDEIRNAPLLGVTIGQWDTALAFREIASGRQTEARLYLERAIDNESFGLFTNPAELE